MPRRAIRARRTKRVVRRRVRTRRRVAARRSVRRRAVRRVVRRRVVRRRRRVTAATAERKHAVRGTLKVQELTKTGTSLRLKIYAEGEKIGDLEIGRGSLFWRGGKRQKVKRLDWSHFAQLMDKMAYEK